MTQTKKSDDEGYWLGGDSDEKNELGEAPRTEDENDDDEGTAANDGSSANSGDENADVCGWDGPSKKTRGLASKTRKRTKKGRLTSSQVVLERRHRDDKNNAHARLQ